MKSIDSTFGPARALRQRYSGLPNPKHVCRAKPEKLLAGRCGGAARFALLGALIALPAFGQDQAIQRELIMRQQQSDAFALQLRQSQQLLQIAPGDFRRRADVEAFQLQQRRELDNLSAQQLTESRRDTPAELRPYERSRFEGERRSLLALPEPVRKFEETPKRSLPPTVGPGRFEIREP